MYFVVAVAVEKWEAAFRFPAFPWPFLFGTCRQPCDRRRLLRPVLFVLHRADVIQCRMKSCLVIPEQPIEGFIFGLTKGFKVLAVHPFHLQIRTASPTRVIPAVAVATHRSLNAAPLRSSWNCWHTGCLDRYDKSALSCDPDSGSQADSTKSASASITVIPPQSVALSWSPSSPEVSYYNVYRRTVSGGTYSLLTNGVSSTSYTDSDVQSGSTYYNVTTAVDSSGSESVYSNEAQAVIPIP